MKKQHIFNFPVNLGSYKEFIDTIVQLAASRVSSYVCVVSVHQLIEAYRDSSFSTISKGADVVTPDGMPITWALRLLYNIKQERVAGMDLLPDLLREAERNQLSVFFYGGTQDMLNGTKNHISENYPSLVLAGLYSPPFRSLTKDEDDEVCRLITESEANLVFVVLGCPKQEKWMASMKNKLQATMVGIGGALPVMIGIQRRAPLWMQTAGLEWLFRLAQEPGRLWKRYFITNTLFILLLLKEKLKQINSSVAS